MKSFHPKITTAGPYISTLQSQYSTYKGEQQSPLKSQLITKHRVKKQDLKFSPIRYFHELSQQRKESKHETLKNVSLLSQYNPSKIQIIPVKNNRLKTERAQTKQLVQRNYRKTRYTKQIYQNRSCECSDCGRCSTFQTKVLKQFPQFVTKQQRKRLVYLRLKKIAFGVLFLIKYRRAQNERMLIKHQALFKKIRYGRVLSNTQSIFNLSKQVMQQNAKFIHDLQKPSNTRSHVTSPRQTKEDNKDENDQSEEFDCFHKSPFSESQEKILHRKAKLSIQMLQPKTTSKPIQHYVNLKKSTSQPDISVNLAQQYYLKSLQQTEKDFRKKRNGITMKSIVGSSHMSRSKNISQDSQDTSSQYNSAYFRIQIKRLQKRL